MKFWKKTHTFILPIIVKGFSLCLQSFLCVTVKFSAFLFLKCKSRFLCIVATLNVDRLRYCREHTNGVFPLTESNSDSDTPCYPIIIETIKICRKWHTGSNSDICSDFNGIAPFFSDRKEYLYLYRSDTVNSNTVNSKFHLIRSFFEIFARFLSFHV